MSLNGASGLHDPDGMTAEWSMPQVQQFYGEMTRRLSAVMVLMDTLPLDEMLKVNARLQAGGVLSLPPDVNGDQARMWLNGLRRDQELFTMLSNALVHLKTP
jgi:hypothetical protein